MKTCLNLEIYKKIELNWIFKNSDFFKIRIIKKKSHQCSTNQYSSPFSVDSPGRLMHYWLMFWGFNRVTYPVCCSSLWLSSLFLTLPFVATGDVADEADSFSEDLALTLGWIHIEKKQMSACCYYIFTFWIKTFNELIRVLPYVSYALCQKKPA